VDIDLTVSADRPVVLTGATPPPPRLGPPAREWDAACPWSVLDRYRQGAIVGDAACAVVAALLASWLRFGASPDASYGLYSALVPVIWLAVLAARGAYEFRYLGTGTEEYRRLAHSGLVLFLAIGVTSYALRGDIARGYVVIVVPATVGLTALARRQLRAWLYRQRAEGLGLQRVVVVGRADAAVALIDRLRREPEHGLVVVGACVAAEGVGVSHVHDVPVLADPSRMLEIVSEAGAHVVAVTSHPDVSGEALRRLAWELEDRGVELVVSPGIVEVAGPRLSVRPVAGLSLLHVERPALSGWRILLKAAFDRFIAALLLVVLAPLMAALAVAARRSTGGPVLRREPMVGAGGRHFDMLRFEAPRPDGWMRRYCLDELPQLLNVLRGEMSLVGPRPMLPADAIVECEDADRRLRARPGLTGLGQVSGLTRRTNEDALNLDLRYIDNWSITLDLTILWRTWRAVVRGAGAR
jgi:lipopolysaccharide/colanic/teichoic acid biosynthesis glycosyltransferase